MLPSPKSERRYFPPFSLCGYSFSLLADPSGNPRAVNQAQAAAGAGAGAAAAAAAANIEKGLSVYLTVAFEDEHPDTPPWGAGVLFHQPFPPPPLQVGPGNPWGSVVGENEDDGGGDGDGRGSETESEGGEWALGSSARRLVGAGPGGGGGAVEKSNGAIVGGNKVQRLSAEGGAAMRRRDPHGLRRRRRRVRGRGGKLKGFSHAGDPTAIARECCAAFSLSAVNAAGRKDMAWDSSMEGNRFFPGRSSWGVHCLLPTSMIKVCFGVDGGSSGGGGIVVSLFICLFVAVVLEIQGAKKHRYSTSHAYRGYLKKKKT